MLTAEDEGKLREIIRETVRLTVRETFERLGVDVADPIEFQRDLQSLREWRLVVQAARKHAILALLGVLVTGSAAALWIGVKSYLKGN